MGWRGGGGLKYVVRKKVNMMHEKFWGQEKCWQLKRSSEKLQPVYLILKGKTDN